MHANNINEGFILWMMGPTSSGKTTLAEALTKALRDNGTKIIHFDGDEVREMLGPALTFESKDRLRVVNTLIYLSNKALEAGVNVVVSALTANPDARACVFGKVKNLIVAHIDCSIEECARRDPKKLYKQAKNGVIDTLIGFNSEYTPPENKAFTINTMKGNKDDCLNEVIGNLISMGRLSKAK